MSKGNKKKVGIIGALLTHANTILLDEPFENLDPTSQFHLIKILEDFNKNPDKTVVITGHSLENIAQVSNRILIMEKGQFIKEINDKTSFISQLKKYFHD